MNMDRWTYKPVGEATPVATAEAIPAGSMRGETVARRFVSASEDELVKLDPDHPGFRDAEYRVRRNAIAKLALEYRVGDPVPEAHYTEAEQEVWRVVRKNLDPLQQTYACREYLECAEKLQLSPEKIPQLREVNEKLAKFTGFQMIPVAGLVTDRRFLSSLGQGLFLSTQYIRHHSTPLYTPEPDVVHELIGHAATFAHPGFAAVNRAFGKAVEKMSDAAVQRAARVYWFTMEFGLTREDGALKAYGAGLLSSFGELGTCTKEPEHRSFDLERMAGHVYDPTQYQKVLYVAPSFDQMVREVTTWVEAQH